MRSLGHCSIVLMFLISVLLPTPLLAVETAPLPLPASISLDYTDADLPVVLKSIAYSYDLNLVISSSIKGKVSAQLKDLTLDEALDAILSVNGYGFSRRDSVVYILPKTEMDLVTESLPMSYMLAKQASDLVSKVLSTRGSIQVNELTNSLLVMDHLENLQKVKALLNEVDQPPLQVLIEARIIDISTKDIEKIGTAMTATYTPTNGGHLTSMDVKTGSSTRDADGGQIQFVPRFSNLSADVKIDALIQKYNGRILASPSIATLSGQEASITIADRYPYKEQVLTGSDKITTSSSTTQFVDVGTKLRVTPMVSPDGWITMKVHPEVSSIIDIPIDSAPQVSTREADATIRVKDNETIVIGGLISKSSNNQRNGVPGLGSIPVLGWFFKRHANDERQSEMMVFITPHIMPSPVKRGSVTGNMPDMNVKTETVTAAPVVDNDTGIKVKMEVKPLEIDAKSDEIKPVAVSTPNIKPVGADNVSISKSEAKNEARVELKDPQQQDMGLMVGLLSYADNLEKDALKKNADNIYIKLELIKTYKMILDQFPQSGKREFCLYKIASIYVKDFAKCDAAGEALSLLKKNFPGSLYIETAQKLFDGCGKAPVALSDKTPDAAQVK